ncbi:MAG: protein-glutamate O-methyltransferase CheR [Desulfobacterales bacterium]|nr:protein-glutamate O-methyltransferase CheR [Desulfobacterales bacterium]
MKISDESFALFSALVYDKCGINLHSGKKELVQARLGRRLRETASRSFEDYYSFLLNKDTGSELVEMLNAISTNLTSFFREIKHFNFMESVVLKDFCDANSTTLKKFNIWSAGCSSGEEPYSLFMCINDFFEKYPKLQINIMATDISTKVLSIAQRGVYEQARLKTVPVDRLRKYFQKGADRWAGYYRIKTKVKENITFRRFNLMDIFPFKEKYDVIFCRNVMIYFDKEIQEKVVNKYYDSLVPGGYLFIGHSESLMGTRNRFSYVKPTIYRKSTNTDGL